MNATPWMKTFMVKRRTPILVVIAIFTTAAPLTIVGDVLGFVTATCKTQCVASYDSYARTKLHIGFDLLL
jgi:hypothetical protein